MTRILQVPEIGSVGRFGNALMFYALGKWYAEKHEAILQTPPWAGEQVFQIDDPPIEGAPNVRLSYPLAPDMEKWDGIAIFNFLEYGFPPQYTDANFRRYLPFRPEVLGDVSRFAKFKVVAHCRRGDFLNAPDKWPIVTPDEMKRAAVKAGYEYRDVEIVTEEAPHHNSMHPRKLDYLEDFLMCCFAPALFVYPASSFSGCAARFNTGDVYIPMDYKNGPTECRWEKRQPQPTKT